MSERTLPIVKVPLFKRGAEVGYNGYTYTVDYVTITSKGMFVHLVGETKSVPEEQLQIVWTELDLEEIRKKNEGN